MSDFETAMSFIVYGGFIGFVIWLILMETWK